MTDQEFDFLLRQVVLEKGVDDKTIDLIEKILEPVPVPEELWGKLQARMQQQNYI